jgi:hypothetical protein
MTFVPNRQTREIQRFKARDQGGQGYEVVIYQEFLEHRSMDSEFSDWIPGLKSIELADGSPINFIDQDSFLIVATGQVIRRSAI